MSDTAVRMHRRAASRATDRSLPDLRRRGVYAPSNPCRPFCSQRCKNNDFGAWASEAYGVEAKPSEDDDEPARRAPTRLCSREVATRSAPTLVAAPSAAIT